MRRDRRARIFGMLVAGVSCSHQSTNTMPPVSLNGNYRFIERPATMTEPISGGIVIRGDTLIAVDDAGICEYDKRASQSANEIVYHCRVATLRFDRRDPIGKATYEATALIDSKQVVCDDRQTRGCSKNRVENTTVSKPIIGVLHLKRLADPQ